MIEGSLEVDAMGLVKVVLLGFQKTAMADFGSVNFVNH